jgi:DNA invertase Pin-like site-specific DNA recombinase
LLHVLGAAAEFERELIRERSKAGRLRYLQDFRAGKVGKTVRRRSGKNLAPHRPKKIFDHARAAQLGAQGLSIREIAKELEIGVGTAVRTSFLLTFGV